LYYLFGEDAGCRRTSKWIEHIDQPFSANKAEFGSIYRAFP
jgi:hypothetical protein